MEVRGEPSLPGRYYEGSNYVVRTPAEDEKIRRLIQASMPPGVRYTPPLVVTPGAELQPVVHEYYDRPLVSVEQTPQPTLSFGRRLVRGLARIIKGN